MDMSAAQDAEATMRVFEKVQARARSETIQDIQTEILRELAKEERRKDKEMNGEFVDLLLQADGFVSLGSTMSDSEDYSSTTLNARWEFRKILSYWSIVTYIVGCLLFVAGCIFAELEVANVEKLDTDARTKALVTYPFVVGSTCFFIGSYISWFRFINKKYKGKGVRFFGYYPNDPAYWRSSLYLAGGLFYVVQNYNKIARDGIGDKVEHKWEVTFFLTIASTLQFIGSILDLNLNGFFSFNYTDFYWWASVLNVLGTIGFAIGSDADWFTDEPGWVNYPYLLGALAFAFGSWIYLWVWKLEQWVFYFPFEESGRVNFTQQIWLLFYMTSLALSICVFVFYTTRAYKFDYFYAMLALFGILFNLGSIQLANALVKLPDDAGWGSMLAYFRFVSLIFLILMMMATSNVYDECYWQTNYEDC